MIQLLIAFQMHKNEFCRVLLQKEHSITYGIIAHEHSITYGIIAHEHSITYGIIAHELFTVMIDIRESMKITA
jgi:hypothetical protein